MTRLLHASLRSFRPSSFAWAFRGGRWLLMAGLALGLLETAHAQSAQVRYSQTEISTPFEKAIALAIDKSGDLYVADLSTFYKLTPGNGTYTKSTITADFQPGSLAVDASGNLFATSSSNGALYEFAFSNGTYTETVLNTPIAYSVAAAYSVAVDAAGDLFVVQGNNLVKGTVAHGIYTSSVVLNNLNLSYNNALAVDGLGDIFIPDTNNNQVIEEVPANGTYTQTTIGTVLKAPDAVSVDAANNVYILDSLHYQILKETPVNGAYTQTQVLTLGYQSYSLASDAAGDIFFLTSSQQLLYEAIPIEEADPAAALDFGTSNVGTATGSMTASFKFLVSGALASTPYTVVTQADTTLDFQPAATQAANQCVTAKTYEVGDVCTVAATFKPVAPGARFGAIQLASPAGVVVGTANLTGFGVGPLAAHPLSVKKAPSYAPISPEGLVVDSSGNLYYAGSGNGIVKENAATGGAPTGPTNIPGISFSLPQPLALALDGSGDLYYTTTGSSVVEDVVINGAFAAQASIGSGMNLAQGMAIDSGGNLYISDTGNNRILKETNLDGAYTQTVIASGFNQPIGIVVDVAGNLYIADSNNNRVVRETPTGSGYTQTVVTTNVNYPLALAIDGFGNLYVSDYNNKRILRETLIDSGYTESVYAKTGYSNGGVGNGQVSFLTIDANGNLYGSEYDGATFGGFLLVVSTQTIPTLGFATTDVGSTSTDSPQTTTLTNIGNAPLTFAVPSSGLNPAITAGFQYGAGSTCPQLGTSSAAATLAPSAVCSAIVSFVPVAPGNITGTLTETDNSLYLVNSMQVLANLVGTATGGGTPKAALTPTAAFGSVQVGTTSLSPQILTLTNAGTAALSITSYSVTAGSAKFAVASTTCTASLAAGSSCTYSLNFSPNAIGAQTGTFSITDAVGTQTAALSGTGVGATLTAAPNPLVFPDTTVNTTATMTVKLSNTGAGVLNFQMTIGTLAGADHANFTVGSGCGATLQPNTSCDLTVTFTPNAVRMFNATFTVPSNDPNSPTIVALSGSGAGLLSIDPITQIFTSTAVGSASAAMTSVITNGTAQTVSLSSGSLSDATDFTQTDNCNGMVAAAKSCTVSFSFTPKSTGTLSSTYSIHDLSNPGSPLTVALSGVATEALVAQAVLSPMALTFTTTVSTQASNQSISLSNPGTAPLSISSVKLGGANSGSFSIVTNGCGTSLAAGGSCNLEIGCTAIMVAGYNATLTVSDNASPTTQTASLTCNVNGVAKATLTPTSLSFSGVTGTSPATQTASLANNGSAALTITSIALGGTNSSVFSLDKSACGATLTAGGSCSLVVGCMATAPGTYSATITATDDASPSTQSAALSCTISGVAQALLTPGSNSFGSIGVGSTSSATSFTLTNGGNAALSVASIALAGADASAFGIESNHCGATLAAGASCSIQVTFQPSIAGTLTASLIATDSVGTQSSTLTGIGLVETPADFSITATPAIQATYRGRSVNYTIQLNSVVGDKPYTDPVALTTSGLPTGIGAAFSSVTLTPGATGASSALTLSVPSLESLQHAPSRPFPQAPVQIALASLGLLWMSRRRRRARALRAAFTVFGLVCSFGLVTLTGCGSGNGFATPSNTYTITVNGTSGAITHTTKIQLTVQ
jgi:sugar lactone lactonase YvrE